VLDSAHYPRHHLSDYCAGCWIDGVAMASAVTGAAQKLAVISAMKPSCPQCPANDAYVPYTEQAKQMLLIQQSVNRSSGR